LKGRLNSRIWGRDAEYRGNDAKIWFGKIMATSLKGCVVDLQDIVRWPVVSANSWIRTSKGRAAIGSGRTGMRDVWLVDYSYSCAMGNMVFPAQEEKKEPN
jgi:hypothetical protein